MVMGSNLGRTKLNSLFAQIPFGMKVKEQRNPSSQKGQPWGWKITIE